MVEQSEQTFTEAVAADGTATVTMFPTRSQVKWIVSQISTELSDAPIGAICSFRKNGNQITPANPRGDVAGGDPPIFVRSSDRLTVEWTGCTPGTVGTVFLIYNEVPA